MVEREQPMVPMVVGAPAATHPEPGLMGRTKAGSGAKVAAPLGLGSRVRVRLAGQPVKLERRVGVRARRPKGHGPHRAQSLPKQTAARAAKLRPTSEAGL
jgi:hypothetical protein